MQSTRDISPIHPLTFTLTYKIKHCFFFLFCFPSDRCAGTRTARIASSNTFLSPFCLFCQFLCRFRVRFCPECAICASRLSSLNPNLPASEPALVLRWNSPDHTSNIFTPTVPTPVSRFTFLLGSTPRPPIEAARIKSIPLLHLARLARSHSRLSHLANLTPPHSTMVIGSTTYVLLLASKYFTAPTSLAHPAPMA